MRHPPVLITPLVLILWKLPLYTHLLLSNHVFKKDMTVPKAESIPVVITTVTVVYPHVSPMKGLVSKEAALIMSN